MNPTHLNYSTIFKTIQDSVDNTKTKLLLFNKDWNTYKKNWQNATGIGGKIGSIFTSTNAKTTIISNEQVKILRTWNNAVAHGCTNQETFNRIIADADDKTKMYFAGLNKGKGSIEGLRKVCGNLSLSSKAAAFGMKALSTAANMLATMAIVKGIELVVSSLSDAIQKTERFKESAKNISNEFNSLRDSFGKNSSTLSELQGKYDELSKGVNSLGENVELSKEKYDEYKDVMSQVSDIMPKMKMRYNAQGQAVSALTGKIKNLNKEYEKIQRQKVIDLFNEKDDNGNNLYDVMHNAEIENESDSWLKEGRHILSDYTDEFNALTSGDIIGFLKKQISNGILNK